MFGIKTQEADKAFLISKFFHDDPRMDEYCRSQGIDHRIFHIYPKKDLAYRWSLLEFIPQSLCKMIHQSGGKIYIAGGSCIPDAPNLQHLPSSDINVFVLNTLDSVAVDTCHKIAQLLTDENYIVGSFPDKSVYAVCPPGKRNITITRSHATSFEKLLLEFDIGVCQWATDCMNIIYSSKALHDFEKSIISLVPGNHLKKDERLVKYKMKGFALDKECCNLLDKSGIVDSKMEEYLLYNYAIIIPNLSLKANIWQLRRQGINIPDRIIDLKFAHEITLSLNPLWLRHGTTLQA